MGSICSIYKLIPADVDLKKDQEIKVILKTNKIINQNQK